MTFPPHDHWFGQTGQPESCNNGSWLLPLQATSESDFGCNTGEKNMSGGRIAISRVDYQAIVILDQLFDHFDQHAGDARARPEGKDDLDLVWTENGLDRRCHVQVKKPRETDQGVPKNQPWRLSEVADELLPNTLSRRSCGWFLTTPIGRVWPKRT
jgi:hypothetical protein